MVLSGLKEFKVAKLIKVNPDAPQRKVRELALRSGKTVLVPTPRLRGEFFLLDPSRVDPAEASSISGFTRLGERVDIYNVERVDLIVVGSVAVTRRGERVGKGEGYSELEYAMLRELGKIDASTPVITTVHPVQIVEEIPTMPYDVSVDVIVSPEEVIRTGGGHKPEGLLLEFLTREKIEETPFLKEFLIRFHRKQQ